MDQRDVFQHIPVAECHRKYSWFLYKVVMTTVRLQPISIDVYAVPQGSAGSAITQGPTPRLVPGRSVGDGQHTGTGYVSYARVDRVSRVCRVHDQLPKEYAMACVPHGVPGSELGHGSRCATLSQERWRTLETVLALFHPGGA